MLVDSLRILGIGFDAKIEDVKRAYRERAMAMHPDTSSSGAEEFIALNKAYKQAMSYAATAPCDHCEKGKINMVRGFNVLKVPCTFCKGTGLRG